MVLPEGNAGRLHVHQISDKEGVCNTCLTFMNAVLPQVCISVFAVGANKWKNKAHRADVSNICS